MIDTVIVSDTHLGSPMSLADELHHLLQSLEFKRLILLGDIFSDLNFSRLTKSHWRLISLIRKLSNPKRNIEVVWVEGNHDRGITMVMEHFLGVKVYQKYIWEWNGLKCLAVHGHQFDSVFSQGNPVWNDILTHLYLWLQKVSFLRNWLPHFLDKFHTQYAQLTEKVAAGALDEAIRDGADRVFCGHTHEVWHEVRDNVHFWNSGCWVGNIGTALLLGDNVEVRETKSLNLIRS